MCPPGATAAADVEGERLKCRVVIGSTGSSGASASIHTIDVMSGFVMRAAIVHKKGEPAAPPFVDLLAFGRLSSSRDLVPQRGAAPADHRADERALLATGRGANARSDASRRADDDGALLDGTLRL